MRINLGICVAYDWHYLALSLPPLYEISDSICLSVDRRGKSWSGTNFEFDKDAFLRLIEQIDKDKKIEVFEEDFYKASLSPRENELRQRHLMAEKMGLGGWHVQLDADEVLLEPTLFVQLLRKYEHVKYAVTIRAVWIHLFKKVEN